MLNEFLRLLDHNSLGQVAVCVKTCIDLLYGVHPVFGAVRHSVKEPLDFHVIVYSHMPCFKKKH